MRFVEACARARRRSLLVGVITLVASAAFAVPTAAQSTNAAQKEPFLVPTGLASCETGATEGVPTGSFAIIKKNHNNTVSTQVALKRAVPNETYEVFLVQTPIFNPEDCFTPDGTIQTNGRGNGNGHFSEPLASGQTGAFVYVTSFFDFQITPNYVFGSK